MQNSSVQLRLQLRQLLLQRRDVGFQLLHALFQRAVVHRHRWCRCAVLRGQRFHVHRAAQQVHVAVFALAALARGALKVVAGAPAQRVGDVGGLRLVVNIVI